MTLKDAFNYSVYFLSGNGVDEPEFKALCIVCGIAGIKNSEYQSHAQEDIMPKQLADALWRLKSGEPLQYVMGKWDFYESEFSVGRGVLIPRPETEELTALAVKAAGKIKAPLVYDLCSGSGCIGISIAKAVPAAAVYCVEKSADAMPYLLKNSNGVKNVFPLSGSIFDTAAFDLAENSIDILVSNPPYIRSKDLQSLQPEVQYEPEEALDGGADGLDFYRCIIKDWKAFLKPGGLLLLEIGDDQGSAVFSLLSENGYQNISIMRDMYANERIASSQKEK